MAHSLGSGLEEAVLKKTTNLSFLNEKVAGYDWSHGLDYNKLLNSYLHSGFQATNFGLAVNEINKMIACRKLPIPEEKFIDNDDEFTAVKNNCTIFLGYTSNIISSGLRETIKFLVQHKMASKAIIYIRTQNQNVINNTTLTILPKRLTSKLMVDCIVTTAGGIEEDFIKCFAPTFMGDFSLDGKTLREAGINRIGNLLVPNDNYCSFENWIMPILDEMLKEQNDGVVWSPSKMIEKLGKEINNDESIYYWASKNKIPVFCPALTDGSIGDMMFMHTFKNPGLMVDIISDLRRLNLMAMKSVNTGMIIIGGGLVKHHICNANLMRNGADYAVYLNTASEFDGSDSGARPDEAKSWGKIKKDATPVKIHGEATLILPLLVAQTFAKHHFNKNR